MKTGMCLGLRNHAGTMFLKLSIVIIIGATSAAAQPANYDGTYAGTQTLTENGSVTNYAKCLKGPFKRKLVVKDGAATYEYNPTYHGTVSADGDVSATEATSSGGVSLSGKILGDQFTGEIWSLICTYSLQLKRTP